MRTLLALLAVVGVTLAAAGASAGANAQTLYRCGNSYSQIPCAGAEQPPRRVYADPVAEPASGPAGSELCEAEAQRVVGALDPNGVRIRFPAASRAEVITFAGRPLPVRRHVLTIEVRGADGLFTTPQPWACDLSEDRRRVLRFAPSTPG